MTYRSTEYELGNQKELSITIKDIPSHSTGNLSLFYYYKDTIGKTNNYNTFKLSNTELNDFNDKTNENEKIDVILYDKDPVKFIQNALSPAKDVEVRIVDEKNREAIAIVNDENSSLAIGKRGQNVKLASRLTKYKIAVKKVGELDEE